MSDLSVNASFSFLATPWESAILRDAQRVASFLATTTSLDAITGFYQDLGEAFRWTFPLAGKPPFTDFLALFADPNNPAFHVDIYMAPHDTESMTVTVQGSHFDPRPIARLLAVACPSIHPFSFPIKPAAIEGGQQAPEGVVIVNENEIYLAHGQFPMFRADITPLVLAQPAEDGPSLFWNGKGQFASLDQAYVYDADDPTIKEVQESLTSLKLVAIPAPK